MKAPSTKALARGQQAPKKHQAPSSNKSTLLTWERCPKCHGLLAMAVMKRRKK